MVLAPFDNPNVAIVFPPKMDKKHLARPGIGLYTQFSMLTDCLAWRTIEIDPDMLLRVYVERQKTGHRLSAVPECAWAQIADEQFHGRTVGVDKLSNPDLYEGKCYLRKASATQGEYIRLAQELGIDGGNFDLREWNAQEGVNYLVRPVVVNELKTS